LFYFGLHLLTSVTIMDDVELMVSVILMMLMTLSVRASLANSPNQLLIGTSEMGQVDASRRISQECATMVKGSSRWKTWRYQILQLPVWITIWIWKLAWSNAWGIVPAQPTQVQLWQVRVGASHGMAICLIQECSLREDRIYMSVWMRLS
jgi:hypothetical protein